MGCGGTPSKACGVLTHFLFQDVRKCFRKEVNAIQDICFVPQYWVFLQFEKVPQRFNSAGVLQGMFQILMAIGKGRLNFTNTSKPQHSSFLDIGKLESRTASCKKLLEDFVSEFDYVSTSLRGAYLLGLTNPLFEIHGDHPDKLRDHPGRVQRWESVF